MLQLKDLKSLKISVDDSAKEILCSSTKDHFAVVELTSGKLAAVWEEHATICDSIEELALHINKHEAQLLTFKIKD